MEFDSSHRPDIDADGIVDFVEAQAFAHSTYSLSGFILDKNGTLKDPLGADRDQQYG